MPTIAIKRVDILSLLGMKGRKVEDLLDLLPLVKGELKEISGDEIRLELCDTNRPDLWCVEGVARQMGYKLGLKGKRYEKGEWGGETPLLQVSPEMEGIRPFVAAFAARGVEVTEEFLLSLIQAQEKLCESFGGRRERVALGVYRLERITFPVRYAGFKPHELKFMPLKFEEPATLEEILEKHPKGKEYGHLIKGFPLYPILIDSRGLVLSMPPITNSRETGEVETGDTSLFIEGTGYEAGVVALALDILAANIIDRGGEIIPVKVTFPYETDLGREVVFPFPLKPEPVHVPLALFSKVLGIEFSFKEVEEALREYGIEVEVAGDHEIAAIPPPYRGDYLHPVDVVEDFAISYGYEKFPPMMPDEFTPGIPSPEREFSDALRDLMIGAGFEETVSNILTSPLYLRGYMGIPAQGNPLVTVKNVMSQSYSALRDSLIPSLLKVEASSMKSAYPHRIFEEGEAVVMAAGSPEGTETISFLSALSSHREAGITEIHQVLAIVFQRIGLDFTLKPTGRFPFLNDGRAAEVVSCGIEVGIAGEVHPSALERWGIRMPTSIFELDLNLLMDLVRKRGKGPGMREKV